MNAGPGHNNGPTMEPGLAWRTHCWSHARRALLPHLPLEVRRGRLKRAAALGLDYSTYAGIRATSGHDVIAVLFSSNALFAPALAVRADRIAEIRAQRIGLASAPLTHTDLDGFALDAIHPAPQHLAPFARQRAAMRTALDRMPGDRALLVGAYPLERDWSVAGGLAGYVDAARYFGPLA